MGREELGKKTGCVLIADLLPGLATKALLMREKNVEKKKKQRLHTFYLNNPI